MKSIYILLILLYITETKAQITVYSENFDSGSGGWTSVDIADATDQWTATNGYMQINGFGGSSDEDWLISPSVNLNNQNNEYLMFDYQDGFNGNLIELFYSVNYNGGGSVSDVQNATWTAMPLNLLDINGTSCFSFLFQRNPAIDISGINGSSVYFAFKYTGATFNSKQYRIDNFHIEADYYQGVQSYINNGGSCDSLKSEICKLLQQNIEVLAYSDTIYDTWDALLITDKRMNDAGTAEIVWDMFTDKPAATGEFEFDHCSDRDNGSCSNVEGNCYNREHTFARSWWGGTTVYPDDTINFDLHHIAPADKNMNYAKFNYPPGNVSSANITGSNGFKVGTNSSYPCSSMQYFEPIDEYKGDYARMFLFVATRYENEIASWYGSNSNGDCALTGAAYPGYAAWMIDVLLEWHANDGVSQKEIDRNNAVYAIQGNRNPFIDNPQWVGFIWGDTAGNNCSQLANACVDTSLNQNGVTLTSNEAAASYQWLDCDNGFTPINGENSQSFTATANGNFAVEITLNGCVDTSSCIAISVLSLTENKNEGITVYPVPAKDIIRIDLMDELIDGEIKLFNMTGQCLFTDILRGLHTTVNIRNFPNGIYKLAIIQDSKRHNFIIVKN